MNQDIDRQRRFHIALQDLLTQRQFSLGGTTDALLYFCKVLCRELHVSRAGIWLLNEAQDKITPLVCWDSQNPQSEVSGPLSLEDARSYFEAIRQDHILAIDDVTTDPRCAELQRSYLPANHILSMLDAPIHTFGGLAGVICAEQTHRKREWDTEEVGFSLAVSGLVSLTLEHEERLKAERAAIQSRDRLRLYTELADHWFWETDTNLAFTHVHGSNSPLGQQPSDYIGKTIQELENISPLKETWEEFTALTSARKQIQSFIVSLEKGSEEPRYIEFSGLAKLDQRRGYLGYWGTAKDVTYRVKQELELAASEQKYRNASRLAKLGSWIWDQRKGRCSYCSPELAEIYGVTVEEYLRRTSSHRSDMCWFHPDDRDHYERTVLEASEEQKGYEVTARIIRDDGSIRVLQEITEPVFDNGGVFIATSGVLLDITEQVELRQKLAEEKERLIGIVNNIPGAVYRLKFNGSYSVIYRSAGFFREFIDANCPRTGWLSSEEKARTLNIPQQHRARIESLLADAAETATPYEFEYPVILDNGQQKWVWERGRTHNMPDGSIEIEGILIDATAKHHAQEALLHAQKIEALGKLTSGVAHDFNNLLAIILGNLEMLREDNADQTLADYISKGVGATLRARELTRNLLSFARKAPLKPSFLELNNVVHRVQGWVERTLPRNIDLQMHLSQGLWPVQVDESSTENALLNLIINARDAMAHGGALRVETRNAEVREGTTDVYQETVDAGRYVQLTVRDTGAGITPEVLEKIFDPFFTTKRATEGSGLGLSTVLGFVKQSGGFIDVQSQPGKGARFDIFFKASDDQPVPFSSHKSELPRSFLFGRKVLIADDEKDVLNLLRQFAESAGMNVTVALTGEEALQIFQADPSYDLLLTDIVMPGNLQGPDLARACRQIKASLPVVFLSGYANEELVAGKALDRNDVRLDKPMKQAELLHTLGKVLSAPI